MKKLSYLIIVLLVSIAGFSQKDTSLTGRLKEYTRLSIDLNFEELMDYMHPSLFELAPKEQLIEAFRNIYENESMKITVVKLENRSISNPFTLKGVKYCKVDYDMEMNMKFKDEKLSDSATVKTMVSTLQEALPGKVVSYSSTHKHYNIKGSDVLLAIKDDPTTPWFFLGYDGSNELVKKLFPEEVVKHFKLQ